MKKRNIVILSLALVAGVGLTGFGLVACAKANQQDQTQDMGSVIKSKEDVYAYSVFSSTSLLSNLDNGVSTLSNERNVTDEEIKKIDDYVEMFNGLLESKGIDQVTEENKDEAYSDYETKMTVKENGKTYVSYLNETAINEEDSDKDEEEINTSLKGIMFEIDSEGNEVANSYYIIEGSKEIENETEDDESESELEIEMTSYLAEKNADGGFDKVNGAKTVTVKQEFETETEDGKTEKEQSFKYTVKDGNGNVIQDECSEIEIEEENDEVSIDLTLGYDEDTAKIYEFTKNGETLEVEVYEGEDNKVESMTIQTVVDENGNKKNVYVFEDESKVEIDE